MLILTNSCSKSIKVKIIELNLLKKISLDKIYSPLKLLGTQNNIFIANSLESSDGKIYVYDYEGKIITVFNTKRTESCSFIAGCY